MIEMLFDGMLERCSIDVLMRMQEKKMLDVRTPLYSKISHTSTLNEVQALHVSDCLPFPSWRSSRRPQRVKSMARYPHVEAIPWPAEYGSS